MRRTARFFTLFAILLGVSPAFGQGFPSKPIHLIIGYGAGGVTDVLNRIVADEAGRRLGQSIVVENRPGAAALVAATAVKNAPPDGYTLFGGSVPEFHPIFMKQSMDASKELVPISTYAFGDWFLYVPTSIGVNNLKDLAAYAKSNPGKVRFSQLATTNTMLFTMVAKRLGFGFDIIPYKTGDQTIASLLSGDCTATFNAASGFDGYIKDGKLKAIAVLSANRTPVRPDVSTAKEQGVDMDIRFNIGMWGPPGLPREVVAKLGGAVRESLGAPNVAEKFRVASLTPTPSTPEEMLRDFNDGIAFYKEAIAISGYQPQ